MAKITTNDLLFEIGTEELPTKTVKLLSLSLAELISKELRDSKLEFTEAKPFGTPRRIAVIIKNLVTKQPDFESEKRGPAIKAAYDNNNKFTKAAIGFAKSCGTTPEKLDVLENKSGSWLIFKEKVKGQDTKDLLENIINNSVNKLPIPKPMRWNDHSYTFVRPVHWLVLLFGSQKIEIELLGIRSDNKSFGHRFLSPKPITIKKPCDYESALEKQFVIADFNTRKENIRQQVEKLAKSKKLNAIIQDSLLDEVTSLVEWPVALMGEFDTKFLKVPQECLISTMVNHQRYFALTDSKNKVSSNFIFISNIKSKNSKQVINGNERVLSARLADAEFFYQNDKNTKLIDRVNDLANIVYQQKLGSLLDKTKRIERLAIKIGKELIKHGIDVNLDDLSRSARLAKADLTTEMVYEFPELQGIMGKYYAKNDHESELIANCIEQHYLPKQAGDSLPESKEACILAIADKLDTLAGIFAIGQKPTGEKDPFGLRRAALGVLRILIEKQLPLDLNLLFKEAATSYTKKSSSVIIFTNEQIIDLASECFNFCLERLKKYYTDQNIAINLYYAVSNTNTTSPYDFHQRILAVNNFLNLPEAEQLIAANKRVKNILNKQANNNLPNEVNSSYLKETAEINLNKVLLDKSTELKPLFTTKEYDNILKKLASLQRPIDNFFDSVMVMAEDNNLKNNRLLLLKKIQLLFNKVADISELQ